MRILLFKRAYGVNPDVVDERVCLAQWNNCAYVISCLGKKKYYKKYYSHSHTLSFYYRIQC